MIRISSGAQFGDDCSPQAAKLEAERTAENFRERLSLAINRAVARNQTAATRSRMHRKKAENPRKLKTSGPRPEARRPTPKETLQEVTDG
jgi:hypothetical protein